MMKTWIFRTFLFEIPLIIIETCRFYSYKRSNTTIRTNRTSQTNRVFFPLHAGPFAVDSHQRVSVYSPQPAAGSRGAQRRE